ncbi:MAG: outer membrane protein OmpH [Francisellaceae bacterium]|nr:outer membrane protein OmpH [Francisellaceae bacterium]
MKIFNKILVGLTAALMAFTLQAAVNIGVLDIEEILTKSPQAERASKTLEKEFTGRKEKLVSKHEAWQEKQKKITRDKDILSKADKEKAEKEIAKLQTELRDLEEEFRNDYNTRNREEIENLSKIVKEVVNNVAKDEKIDAVFSSQTAIYVGPNADVTQKVMAALKKLPEPSVNTPENKEKDKK